MKTRFILIGVAALALTAISCNKQEVLNEKETVKETVEENSVSITAVWDDATKANVTDGGAFTWTATTDKVAYWKDGAWAQSGGAQTGDVATTNFTINDTYRGNWAVYPYSIIDNAPNKNTKYGQSGTALNVYLPKTYELGSTDLVANGNVHLCCPMIADNSQLVADGWSFKQLCGIFRMTVNCIPPSVDKITVDFGHPVAGSFDIPAGIAPATSSIAYANAAGDNSNVVTITFNAAGGTTWRDNVTFNLPWPTGEYSDITITMYNGTTEVISMTRPAGKIGVYTAARAHGRKVAAGFPIFSVDTDTRVVIAKSNLQFTRDAIKAGTPWTMADGTWSFMQYPWSRVETKDVSVDHIDETAIGLFAWGTSGYDWPETPVNLSELYGEKRYPWNTVETRTEGAKFGPIWGNSQGVNDLTGVFKYGDWGYTARADLAAANSKDDREWRSMTTIEVKNLLARKGINTIEVGDDPDAVCQQRRLQYGGAKVNNINGLVILPDYFVDPKTNDLGGDTHEFTKNVPNYTTNRYTVDGWKAMDAAGAVFLPASGCIMNNRSTDTPRYMFYLSDGAYYDTSTAYSAENRWTYYIDGGKIVCQQNNGQGNHVARSVRLVYTIK